MFGKLKIALLSSALLAPVAYAVPVQSWTLDNGAKVMLVQSHQNPIVDIDISFDAGTRRDVPNKIGVANFTAELLNTGSADLNEEAFNQKTAQLAINLGSSSSLESADVQLRSLSKPEVLKPALSLMNLVLTKPRFDPNVLKREQDRSILGLKQSETDPGFLAARAISLLNYENHPYGYSAKQTEQTIRAIKQEDLVQFYQQFYVTTNAVVSIVGDVDKEQANEIAVNLLKGLPKGEAKSVVAAVDVKGGQDKRIAHPASQAHVRLALPVLTRDDPDYYPLLVGNYILGGGGFDSRLMKVLRDQNGLTYGVGSSLAPYKQKGPLTIGFSTKKDQAQLALDLTKKTLAGFIEQGPTDEELKQAKDNIIGGFPLRFDSNLKLLGYLSVMGQYDLPLTFLDDYPAKVEKLTKEDIKKAWQKRIKAEELNVVIVGGSK
ncbi:M16 family metallopeptidase [Neisseria sp. Ec49-e6-T10]|uniref:M16 family metallopeptidase n=1 Tax=Neisseria sp. Ec49-e6-T10 TaxID=3140744 RepID=UPI003EBA3A0B